MSFLHSHLNMLGSFPIQCPNCRKTDDFKLIYTNLSLGPFGLSLYPAHRRVAAVCPNCTRLYYLKKDTARRVVARRTVAITKEELLTKPEDFGKLSRKE